MAIPRIASTVQPGAATPKLNDLDVDIAPGDRRIVHHGRGLEDIDGKDRISASIEFDIEVEHIDLLFPDNWGLVCCAQTGEIYPDIRRYTCTPGRNFSGVRTSRRGDATDAGSHAFNKGRPPLRLDSSGDFYWFQGQAIFPVHSIIGSSKDSYWQIGGEEERNAWRLQFLDPGVVALFEQRFAHRIPGFEGTYDPKRPPSPGLVPWQGMSVDAVVRDLATYQRRLASTPRATPEADRALACYHMARLNVEALIERFAAWRAGRRYETLQEWFERREPRRRELLGGVSPYMFGAKLAAAPVNLDVERERVATQLKAEAVAAGNMAMQEQMTAMLQHIEAQKAELEAQREAFRAETREAVEGMERKLATIQAGIGGEADVLRDLDKATAQKAEPPAPPVPPPAPPKEAAPPKALLKGRAAAAAGESREGNPYERVLEHDLWNQGFDSYKAPTGA